MCLAIPGKVISLTTGDLLERVGRVEFGATVIREVSVACVPDVRVGDYVLVHAGFALTVLDEHEASLAVVSPEFPREIPR